jgi:hypothetical protein
MKWHYVLPEDGTHVTEDAGEAHLMFVLIENVHLVGKEMIYADIKNSWNG